MQRESEILDRTPPCDIEAERWVLGSILLMPKLLSDVLEIVRPNDFHSEAHSDIMAEMVRLDDAGKGIDVGTITTGLRRAKILEAVGGAGYVASLYEDTPVWRHWQDYAEIVREKAVARRLINAMVEGLRRAYDPTMTPRDVLAATEADLSKIDQGGGNDGAAVHIKEAAESALERAYAAQRGEKFGIATGLHCIDSITGGLYRSEFTILAARPSQGKSALAAQWADYISMRNDVLFVSLEMTKAELAGRILCRRASVDSGRIRQATLDQTELDKLIRSGSQVMNTGLWMQDRAAMTMRDIRRSTSRLASQGKLAAVFIDYLQLVDAADGRKNRYEQLGDIAKSCKRLAKEFDIAVVALCQVSRAADGEMPKLIHLRESGNLEQEADTVYALMRNVAWGQHDTPSDSKAALAVLKARNAALATTHLEWHGPYTRFSDPNSGNYETTQVSADGFGDEWNP